MADNYLEKKYEDLRNGKTVIRRVNPSLDCLLSKVGENASASERNYPIKKAQLDAMTASASRLSEDCSFETDEASARITVGCKSEYILGRACLAIQLKAAELKLQSSVDGNVVHIYK